jgi:putative acetyltransferase
VIVREEVPADIEAIRNVNRLAFGGAEEADLVDALRASALVVVSLVATEADEVIGHALFSRLPIETRTTDTFQAAALAPVAVLPQYQRRGAGSALIRQGLEICRERGWVAVIVVGHPDYYPRFGFSAELARGLRAPFSGPAFMALELLPGALRNIPGTVRYPPAFGLQ